MKIFFLLAAYLQYLAIRILGLLYELVPPEKAYDLGAACLRFFYPLLRQRRRIAIDNILHSGITESPAEADRIAKMAFGHLGGHICEVFKIGKVINADNWREHISSDADEESRKLMLEALDKPVILLTGHLGVWEAGVCIVSMWRPMFAVARRMNNPFVERFMKERHFRGDITVVDKNRGFSTSILKQWKQSAAVMALVVDQHAGRKTGMRINFMGRETGTHTSPARLHLRSGAPVVLGAMIREAPFQYKLVGGPPIRFTPSGNREQDIKTLLELFNNGLEQFIRAYPEQYLWAHNRWKEGTPGKKRRRKKNGG